MITLLIWLVILLIIFGVLFYVIDMLPAEPQFKNLAKILLALVLVLLLLGAVFGGISIPPFRAIQ